MQVVLLGVVGVALSAPVPEDGPAPAAVPHLLPYAAIYPYAGVPLLYAPLGKFNKYKFSFIFENFTIFARLITKI